MGTLGKQAALDALQAAYDRLTGTVSELTGADMMQPSRCAGWTVADVLYHQLLDARRALRAFATPATGAADRDYISYWRDYRPADDPAHSAGAAEHARHVRIVASAYPPAALAWEWSETSSAACRAARSCPYEAVATQGHVLAITDFVATLVVEAAVHYLDLTVGLAAAGGAAPAGLALVCDVLAGLLGSDLPAGWDDVTCVLKGTGREALTADDRRLLGPLAGRFPLFA